MFGKKNISILLAILLFAILVGCSGSPSPEPESAPEETNQSEIATQKAVEMPSHIGIGTAGTGGTYYVIGAGIGDILTRELGVPSVGEVTAGSPENIRLMDAGEMIMGVLSAEDADLARKGIDPYSKEYDVLAVAPLYPNVTQPIVLANSSIQTIEDLRGKRVAVGVVGGGVYTMNAVLLGTLGIDIETDIVPVEIGFSDAATALRDGTVDAAFQTTGAPASFAMEIESTHPIRLISLSDEEIEILIEEQIYYHPIAIPAGTYRTVEESVNTIGSWALLGVDGSLDEDVVYEITKCIFENLDQLREVHAVANFTDPENLIYSSVPYHPGAIKYFEEMGYTYQ